MNYIKSIFLGTVAAIFTMTIMTAFKFPPFFTGWMSCMSYIYVSKYFEKNAES